MSLINVKIGDISLVARLERDLAPRTVARFADMMPFTNRIIHCRWSGEGCWIPFGDDRFDIPFENHTSHPAPGQFILYPGGYGEAEILLAYGGVSFSSKVGPLAGNHFITVTKGLEHLPEVGRRVLWEGAQDIGFSVL